MVQVPAARLRLSVGEGLRQHTERGRANGGRSCAAACREVVMWQEGKEQLRTATAAFAPASRALGPAVLP